MSMLFRTAQIVWRAADLALTQTHYAAAFTKTLDVYFRATHDSCSQLRRGACDSALPRPLERCQRFAAIRRSYECQLRPRCEFRVVLPCRVRGRRSASKCQIEPETQKIRVARP